MKSTFSLKQLSRLFHPEREQVPELIVPMREWAVLLAVALMVTCVLFGYAGYRFYHQLSLSDASEVIEPSIPTYDERRVDQVLDTFGARADRFATLRAIGAVTVVPEPVPETVPDVPVAVEPTAE